MGNNQRNTKGNTKQKKLISRILAVILVFSLVVPNLPIWAAEGENFSQQPDTDSSSIALTALGSSITEDDTEDGVNDRYIIHAPDQVVNVNDIKTFDPLQGVTVTGPTEEDYSQYLTVKQPEAFLQEHIGTYIFQYSLEIDENIVANTSAAIIVMSDYVIDAPDLVLPLGKYQDLKEINFLEGVTAKNADGEDVSEKLQVVAQNNEPVVDLTKTGEYNVTIAVVLEDKQVAQTTRKIIVQDGEVLFEAKDITLYLSDLKPGTDETFSKKVRAGLRAKDKDGNLLNSYIVVKDDGGGGDFTTLGTYTTKYEVVKDGKTLAAATRTITVKAERPPKLQSRAFDANSVIMGGDETRDALKLSVNTDGTIGFRKWMVIPPSIAGATKDTAHLQVGQKTWVPQYFSPLYGGDGTTNQEADANGFTLYINGEGYATSYFYDIIDFNELIESAMVEKSPQSTPNKEIVTRTYILPDTAIIREHIILNKGEDVVQRKFEITNISDKPQNYEFNYGGDTLFSGYDNGWANFTRQGGGSATVFRGPDQGFMQLKGSLNRPATKWAVGERNAVKSAAQYNWDPDYGVDDHYVINDGNWQMLDLNDPDQKEAWNSTYPSSKYANPPYAYADMAYAMQWVGGNIAPDKTWDVTIYETFADAGRIKLVSSGDLEAPPKVRVTHQFTIYNNDLVDRNIFDINFTASSSNNWDYKIEPERMTSLGPGEDRLILVHVWVPQDVLGGMEDVLTLSATYQDPTTSVPTIIQADSRTRTIVNPKIPVIQDVIVTHIDLQTLDTEIRFFIPDNNGDHIDKAVKMRLTVQDDRFNAVPGIPPVEQLMKSGNQIKGIDISSLTAGQTYYLLAEAVDPNEIPYPHNSTSFEYGKNYIRPTSLKLVPDVINLKQSEIHDGFTVEYTPANTTEQDVEWTSSNNTVVTVNRVSGKITAQSVGTATITATSSSNPSVSATATVIVSAPVETLTVTPTTVTLKKGDNATLTANVGPANASDKSLTWVSDKPTIVSTQNLTTDKTSATQQAKVNGLNDGTATIKVTSTDTPTLSRNVTVNVDGTAPQFDVFKLEKTGLGWRMVDTNEQLKATLQASDPATNGFASGVDAIYYQITLGNAPAPTFNPANPTGWTKVDGTTATFTIDATTVPGSGADGSYKVYAVVVDKVGNYSNVTDGGEDIAVDTSKPDIGLVQGAARDIHVLQNGTVDLARDIVATDNGVDVSSKLVITPATADTTQPSKQTITYSYTDKAGNKTEFTRTLYVHGKPSISANQTVEVNEMEQKIRLMNVPDARIGFTAPPIKHYDTAGNELNTDPTLSVSGLYLSGNNIEFSKVPGTAYPKTTNFTYNGFYNNNIFNPSQIFADSVKVELKIYKNGSVPDGPGVDIGDGVVKPPDTLPPGDIGDPDKDPGLDPDLTNPLDPTGVHRIEYYQNHGAIRKDGTRQPTLTAQDITSSVTTSTGVTKTVTIENALGQAETLDDAALQEALKTVGQKTIVFRLEDDKTHAVTFYTVYLRVNGDIVPNTLNPIDTLQGTMLTQGDYTGANGLVANYSDYTKTLVALTVTNPSTPNTATIRSYNISYSVAYPYETKTYNRLVRVHGPIVVGSADAAHIRVGEAIPTGGIRATVELAPVDVGNTPVKEDVTTIVPSGAIGNINIVHKFSQTYTLSHKLGAGYGTGANFTIEGNTQRDVSVHDNIAINATNIVVAPAYTKAQFGDPRDNLLVRFTTNVQYQGQTPLDLKTYATYSNVDDIKFGTPGIYKLTFTVTDNTVPTRPAGLAAQTKTYEMTVTVSTGNIGLGPTISGNKDLNWIEGLTITGNDLLGHVSGLDNYTNNPTPVTYVLKDKNNNVITAAQAVASPGISTIEYTAIDSVGNVTTVQNTLSVYGKISFISKNIEKDIKLGTALGDINIDDVQASYKNPDNSTVVITPVNAKAQFVHSNGNLNSNVVGIYTSDLTVTHPFFAAHNDTQLVQVRVHGIPVINAKDTVRFNQAEGTVKVAGTTADPRLGLDIPQVIYYVKANGSVQQTGTDPSLVATGTHVNTETLNLAAVPLNANGGTTGNTEVKLTATYTNGLLNPTTVSTDKTIAVEVYKNGVDPGDNNKPVTPEVDPGGVVKPPVTPPPGGGDPGVDPDLVDPLDPTGVNRIEYYQNHGVLLANGGKKTTLLDTDIANAVKEPNATSTVIKIENASGNMVPLTQATLNEALQTIGQKKVVYEFKRVNATDPSDYVVTFFTVYLRVNGDLKTVDANPIDTELNAVVDPAAYTGANNMKATYQDYRKQTVNITVEAPNDSDLITNTIRSYNINYTAHYPYTTVALSRLLRVHGNIVLQANDIHLRVGSLSIPRTGVSATVDLAPPTVGTTPTTVTITDIHQDTLGGDLTNISTFTQPYTATHTLGSAYGTGANYKLEATANRNVYVHGLPTITGNNLTFGLGYTAAMFGDPLTNPAVNMQAAVKYVGQTSVDLKNNVQVAFNNVNFGTPGTYQIIFKVTDANAAGRPGNLPAVEANHTINITISDATVGNPPTIADNKDIDWLEGKDIDALALLGHVTALDNNKNTPITPVLVVTDSAGKVVTNISTLSNSYGEYNLSYTVLDSVGNVLQAQNKLYVYGKVSLNFGPETIVTRVGKITGSDAYKDIVKAEYKNPQGITVTMTPASHNAAFTYAGVADYTKAGRYTVTTTVQHPVFTGDPTAKDQNTIIQLDLYGALIVEGADELFNKRHRTGAGVTPSDTLKVTYEDLNNNIVTVPITVSPIGLIRPKSPSITIVTYDYYDDILKEQHNESKEIKMDKIAVSAKLAYFGDAGISTPDDVRKQFTNSPPIVHWAEAPAVTVQLDPTEYRYYIDDSAVDYSQVGVYTVPVYLDMEGYTALKVMDGKVTLT